MDIQPSTHARTCSFSRVCTLQLFIGPENLTVQGRSMSHHVLGGGDVLYRAPFDLHSHTPVSSLTSLGVVVEILWDCT